MLGAAAWDELEERALDRGGRLLRLAKRRRGYGSTLLVRSREHRLLARSPIYLKQADRGKRPRRPVFDDLSELVRHDGEDPPLVHWRTLYANNCPIP